MIYVLDGNLLFQSVRAMQNGMALTRELPEAFVVGIGYDTTDFPSISGKRNRDLSPTDGGEHRALFPSDPRYPFGGAASFLNFLIAELKPAIERDYPVDAADCTLVGSSVGGLFASWVLLRNRGRSSDTFCAAPRCGGMARGCGNGWRNAGPRRISSRPECS